MANALDSLSPDQVAGLLQLLESQKAAQVGTRSGPRVQLTNLATPQNAQAKLHRPTFSFSADEDPNKQPYVHQPFPTLRFHARQGEIAVMNQEALDALGPDWHDQPIHLKPVSPLDAARAELDSLSEEDRQLVLTMQKQAKMNRINAALSSLTESEQQTLMASTPDVVKRGPGRPKKSDV